MLSYHDILANAQQLSPSDISTSLQQELRSSSQPKRSLLGIWEGLDLSEKDIDQVRDEIWNNFPREDIER